jgi:hypothetical protein
LFTESKLPPKVSAASAVENRAGVVGLSRDGFSASLTDVIIPEIAGMPADAGANGLHHFENQDNGLGLCSASLRLNHGDAATAGLTWLPPVGLQRQSQDVCPRDHPVEENLRSHHQSVLSYGPTTEVTQASPLCDSSSMNISTLAGGALAPNVEVLSQRLLLLQVFLFVLYSKFCLQVFDTERHDHSLLISIGGKGATQLSRPFLFSDLLLHPMN